MTVGPNTHIHRSATVPASVRENRPSDALRASSTAPAMTCASASSNGVGQPAEVPYGGWRDRVSSTPGLGQAYRVSVFVVGLLFIAVGIALAPLPGPLTIPPVLIGLWIWSTEFRFAERLFKSLQPRAKDAWEHAKGHPLSSTLITLGGLVAAGAMAWAGLHYELIDKGRSAIGI